MDAEELNEKYAALVDRLSKVEDPETKEHVIYLIGNGFVPFKFETLGKARVSSDSGRETS